MFADQAAVIFHRIEAGDIVFVQNFIAQEKQNQPNFDIDNIWLFQEKEGLFYFFPYRENVAYEELTYFVVAAMTNQTAVMEHLINEGADPSFGNNAALYQAAKLGFFAAVEKLLTYPEVQNQIEKDAFNVFEYFQHHSQYVLNLMLKIPKLSALYSEFEQFPADPMLIETRKRPLTFLSEDTGMMEVNEKPSHSKRVKTR